METLERLKMLPSTKETTGQKILRTMSEYWGHFLKMIRGDFRHGRESNISTSKKLKNQRASAKTVHSRKIFRTKTDRTHKTANKPECDNFTLLNTLIELKEEDPIIYANLPKKMTDLCENEQQLSNDELKHALDLIKDTKILTQKLQKQGYIYDIKLGWCRSFKALMQNPQNFDSLITDKNRFQPEDKWEYSGKTGQMHHLNSISLPSPYYNTETVQAEFEYTDPQEWRYYPITDGLIPCSNPGGNDTECTVHLRCEMKGHDTEYWKCTLSDTKELQKNWKKQITEPAVQFNKLVKKYGF